MPVEDIVSNYEHGDSSQRDLDEVSGSCPIIKELLSYVESAMRLRVLFESNAQSPFK
ncbi:MAG TPA: hypothetical protein VGK01_20435 [Candidatus Angelobacter sp.]|jgi:hypothetical protein